MSENEAEFTPASSSDSTDVDLETTPSTRTRRDTQTPQAAKDRVDKADEAINGCRCLVEGWPKDPGVQYCHIVPRRLSYRGTIMKSLEYYWKMQHKSLNLDSRYNIFLAGATLHTLHDADQWKLLPSEDIVKQYLSHIGPSSANCRAKFPTITAPNDFFEYKFLPLGPSVKHRGPLRAKLHEHDAPHLETHVYPFKTLPVLRSHIHPKFTICELGRYLDGLVDEKIVEIQNKFEIGWLLDILKIYDKWTSRVPHGGTRNPSFKSESDYEGDDDSDAERKSTKTNNTRPRRIGIKRPREADSPSPKSKRNRGNAENTRRNERTTGQGMSGLSRKTLVDHDAVIKGGWTKESVSTWAHSVALET